MEGMKNYDNFNNDKLYISGMEIYNLEKFMKNFGEEDLNEIINKLEYIFTNKNNIEKKHLEELIEEIENYLKEDISFFFEGKKIFFEKTLVAFHRENIKLVEDLKKYIDDFLKNTEKTKLMKYIEKKLSISSKFLDKKKSLEKNLTILLKQIAINFKSNFVKYKQFSE